MLQSIKKITVLSLIITAFLSCSNEPTLQTYYVDNAQKSGFVTGDIPVSILNLETSTLTEQQERAYNSVDKLNILAYKLEADNKANFEAELVKLKSILKQPKYQELMRGGNSEDGKFVVKFLGETNKIEELIVFVSANDRGFLVTRVLGDDMNAKDLMSLQSILDNANIDDSQLDMLTNFFK